ncbi:MAG: hypothetical protein ACR2GV_01275, partial [Gaiellaceae bacterium]
MSEGARERDVHIAKSRPLRRFVGAAAEALARREPAGVRAAIRRRGDLPRRRRLVAGFAGLEWTAIVLVMVLAYLLVIVFDVAVSRTGAWPAQGAVRRRTRGRAEETPAAPPA